MRRRLFKTMLYVCATPPILGVVTGVTVLIWFHQLREDIM